MMSVTKLRWLHFLQVAGLEYFRTTTVRAASQERESRHSTRIDYHVTLVAKFRGHMIHIEVNKMADSTYKFVV